MEYIDLIKIVTGRLFNPLNDNDQADIIKNVNSNDFLQKTYKKIFEFAKEKYNNRGKVPRVSELAVEPSIALTIVNSSKDIKKEFKRADKFEFQEIKEILEFNSDMEKDENSVKMIEMIKDVLDKKIKFNEEIYNQDIMYYIEKFKNAKKFQKAKNALFKAEFNLEEMEKKGLEFKPNKIFEYGLDAFLPEDIIDNRNIEEIVEENRKNERSGNRIPTYIPTIDKEYRLGGIRKGEVGTIGANTGVGKTFLGLVMFYNQIIKGHNVYYMTLEESKDEIIQRILSIHSNLIPKFREMNIKSNEWEGMGYNSKRIDQLDEVVQDLKKYNFPKHIIDVTGNTSYYNIKQQLTNLTIGKNKAELIYIDYLQMVSTENKDTMASSYKEAMEDLISFARANKIAIIGLAQLNDPVGDKPKKGDIRWSKSFANNSHFVYLLYREDYGLTKEELELKGLENNKKMELIIDKNRGTGKAFGMVPLFFDQEYGYIQEYTDKHMLEQIEDLEKRKKEIEEEGTKVNTLAETVENELEKKSKNKSEESPMISIDELTKEFETSES